MTVRGLLPPLPPEDPHGAEDIGVYVHVPFCARLCSYCDFYKLKERAGVRMAYVDALRKQLCGLGEAWRSAVAGRQVGSVYVGGGTPTELGGALLAAVLRAVAEAFPVAPSAEITVECNPEDARDDVFGPVVAAGANRVSIGIQSLDPGELAMLDRNHGPAQAVAAVEAARDAGFQSVSVDVIVGLPGQDRARAAATLDAVAALSPDHVSAYLLELDKETPIKRRIDAGELPAPDDEVQGAIYGDVAAVLQGAGLERYEISSLARDGHRSAHNLRYWSDAPYLGAGPSAASYIGPHRFTRRADLAGFLRDPVAAVGDPSAFVHEEMSSERRLRDALMLGLRLRSGVDLPSLVARHGAQPILGELDALVREGLLEPGPAGPRIPATLLPVANFVLARVS